MHTDDAALVCGETTFGRKEHVPVDTVQIDRRHLPRSQRLARSNPKYYTKTGSWEVGEELIPPESDTSLGAYVESGYEFEGVTTLNLEGNKVTVTNANYNGGKAKQIALPKNGLIWVHSQEKPACEFKYEQEPADTAAEIAKEVPCGTVYVKGNYSEALTIGAEKEIVIKGSLTPTGVTLPATGETPKTSPPGTATLGLIASEFIRMYNPCNGGNAEGPKDPWIYAAMLSTAHSFLVDNFALQRRPRIPQHRRRHRAELPRRRRDHRQYGLPEELQLRRTPRHRRASLLPRPAEGGLEDRPRDRARRRLASPRPASGPPRGAARALARSCPAQTVCGKTLRHLQRSTDASAPPASEDLGKSGFRLKEEP